MFYQYLCHDVKEIIKSNEYGMKKVDTLLILCIILNIFKSEYIKVYC